MSSSVSSHHYLLSTPPPPPHAPLAPSPVQQWFSSSSADSGVSYSTAGTGLSGDSQSMQHHSRRSPPLPPRPNYLPGGRGSSLPSHGRWRSASQGQNVSPRLFIYSDLGMLMMDPNRPGNFYSDLDLVQQHYCTAYRMEELKTFHCDRVRKMPLSGLDPSMLIGFLCRDEADWWDFRKRVGEVCCALLLLFFVFIDFPLLASENDIFCTGRTSYMAY